MSWIHPQHDGRTLRFAYAASGKGFWLGWPGGAKYFGPETRTAAVAGRVENDVRAPMTAKVVKVNVVTGADVAEGDVVVVLEAMKMEYRLAAPRAGRVASVSCKAGDLVALGATLVVLA